MDISKFISDLLFDHECVVIPGFGGFVANDRPATINRISHQLKPPFRRILFNVHLVDNDGLLYNHISTSLGITFTKARSITDPFVDSLKEKLENGEEVKLADIGTFHYDGNRNLVFLQDLTKNYHPEAYGLTAFVSAPVNSNAADEGAAGILRPVKRTEKPHTYRKAEDFLKKTDRKTNRKSLILPIAFVALFLLGSWGYINRTQVKIFWNNTAAVIPAGLKGINIGGNSNITNSASYVPRKLVESDADILARIKKLDEAMVKMELPEKPEAKVNKPSSSPEALKKTAETKNDISVKPAVRSKLYFIIAGSFSNENNALKLVNHLQQKGYRASIADTNSKGMFRVAYTGIEKLSEAKEKLYAIRQDENPDAWLYRK